MLQGITPRKLRALQDLLDIHTLDEARQGQILSVANSLIC